MVKKYHFQFLNLFDLTQHSREANNTVLDLGDIVKPVMFMKKTYQKNVDNSLSDCSF
jgi:hypothetical protein